MTEGNKIEKRYKNFMPLYESEAQNAVLGENPEKICGNWPIHEARMGG